MLMIISSLLTGILASGVMAQDATTTLMAPQAGETPTGDYTGKYRPQVHFSPPVVSSFLAGVWSPD
jgi:hypothetical protein